MISGNAHINLDNDFSCIDESTIIAMNNAGAGFLLGYTTLLMIYSLMIWVVFYKVPDYYKLITKRKDPLNLDGIIVDKI